MSLPKVIVLTVPRDTDEQGLESVKALLLRAVPEYSEPDADALIKMADSARLVDLEALQRPAENSEDYHEHLDVDEDDIPECSVCAENNGWNAALRHIAALGEGSTDANPTPRCARCGMPLGGYAVCRPGSAEMYCTETCAKGG